MKKILVFALLALSSGSGVALAAGLPAAMPECSGRLTFTLPGDFDIASVPYQTLLKNISVFGRGEGFRFTDREPAEFAKVRYLGPMLISDELVEREISDAVKIFKDEKNRRAKNKSTDVNRPFGIVNVPKFAKDFEAWSEGDELRVLFRLKQHLLYVSVNNSENVSENIASAVGLSKNVEFREKSKVPPRNAICLPYAVVKQGEQGAFGEVATLYKLKLHPDVTIMVSDSTMFANASASSDRTMAEKAAINDFWGQNQLYADVEKIEKGFPLKNGRSIELAGQKGTASYVRIVRKNGAVDYGYYGVSHGSLGKMSESNIGIYIITHSQLAKDKSITPVSSDEFLKMVDLVQNSMRMIDN
jgi:hypothetical protein